MRGHFVEGRHWLEQAINATKGGVQAQLGAQALASAADLARPQGDMAVAQQWSEQSVLRVGTVIGQASPCPMTG